MDTEFPLEQMVWESQSVAVPSGNQVVLAALLNQGWEPYSVTRVNDCLNEYHLKRKRIIFGKAHKKYDEFPNGLPLYPGEW